MKTDEIRPVGRPPRKARDSYNRLAPIYDLVAHPFERRHTRVAVELLTPLPGEALLEPGCGTGNNLVTLAVRLYEWFHDRFPESLDCRPIHPARHLSSAGFTVEEVRQLSLAGIPVDAVRAAP